MHAVRARDDGLLVRVDAGRGAAGSAGLEADELLRVHLDLDLGHSHPVADGLHADLDLLPPAGFGALDEVDS